MAASMAARVGVPIGGLGRSTVILPSPKTEAIFRKRLKFRDCRRFDRKAAADAECEHLLVDDDARNILRKRDGAQMRDRDELFEGLWQGPEAITHACGDLVDFGLAARACKLLIDGDLLRNLRNIIVRYVGVDLDVDYRLAG